MACDSVPFSLLLNGPSRYKLRRKYPRHPFEREGLSQLRTSSETISFLEESTVGQKKERALFHCSATLRHSAGVGQPTRALQPSTKIPSISEAILAAPDMPLMLASLMLTPHNREKQDQPQCTTTGCCVAWQESLKIRIVP